jgi:hypothetical protein
MIVMYGVLHATALWELNASESLVQRGKMYKVQHPAPRFPVHHQLPIVNPQSCSQR